jgi:hypothetical protein
VRARLGLKGGMGDGAGISQPGVAENLPTGFGGGKSGFRALRDHRPLLLGEGGVQVQQERLDIGAEIGDQKRRLVRHEAADEVHVAREAVELGDRDRARIRPAVDEL